MTLVKNSSGIYEGDFRRKGVKRLHLSLATRAKKIAVSRHAAVVKLFRQKRLEMIEQLRTGVLTIERLEAIVEAHEPLVPIAIAGAERHEAPWGTVEQAVDRYLAYLRDHPNKAEGTYDIATWQIKPFVEFMYEGLRTGDRQLDEVPRALIDAYQRTYTDAGRSPNVVTANMTRVGALWRWAAQEEARDANEQRRAPRWLYSPIDRDKLVRDYRPRERFLTEDEIERLLAATPEPLLFPILAAVGMGLRLGEVLHLRPRIDVDIDVGAISIRKHDDWRPKTRRSTRVIPMTNEINGIAARHIERWSSSAWMAPGRDRRRPLTEDAFGRQFKQVVQRAEITYGRDEPEGVTFHTLRHTFASHAVMNGVDLYTLAQLLGDALDTVEKTYAHLSPDFKRAALAKVAAAIKLPQKVTQKTEPKP